jgi:hypothetical protein
METETETLLKFGVNGHNDKPPKEKIKSKKKHKTKKKEILLKAAGNTGRKRCCR